LTKPVRAQEIYNAILFHTGLVVDQNLELNVKTNDLELSPELINRLKNDDLDKTALNLQKKLNTRELGKFIDKINLIADKEENLKGYVSDLKLALETFNVYKIKNLLQKLTT